MRTLQSPFVVAAWNAATQLRDEHGHMDRRHAAFSYIIDGAMRVGDFAAIKAIRLLHEADMFIEDLWRIDIVLERHGIA